MREEFEAAASAKVPNAKQNHFEDYQAYNQALRTWFLTFGIGVPALFLINDAAGKKLSASPDHNVIIGCYLVGCFLQVAIALVNKTTAWYAYDQNTRPLRFHQAFRKIEGMFGIDMAFDLATVGLFVYATWDLFGIFA
jgi:hypothetical protein